MDKSNGQMITETGHYITVNGEKIEVGILSKTKGNARILRKNGSLEIKGVFGLVQWFRRGEPFEKIAYNTAASSVGGAKKEMEMWIPRLQYPEYRESSVLIGIIEHSEESTVTIKTKIHSSVPRA